MPETLYTIVDTARALGVHPDTIRRWIKEGRLNAVRVGIKYKIRQSEIDRVLKEGTLKENQ